MALWVFVLILIQPLLYLSSFFNIAIKLDYFAVRFKKVLTIMHFTSKLAKWIENNFHL
jgi:hypothetical protein